MPRGRPRKTTSVTASRPAAPRTPQQTLREMARELRQRAGLGYLYAPRGLMDSALEEFNNAMMGRIPPPAMLTPETLRYMAERSKTFGAILRRRSQQIAQFARRPLFDGDTGFEVVPKDQHHTPTPAEKAEARRIEDMLLRTGTVYNPRRTDNLRTALQKLLADTYMFDAMVVEPVIDDDGKLIEWWVLDGGSIQRVNPEIYEPLTELGKISKPITYVQVEHETVKAEWNADELIYVVRNPSSSLGRFGYGQPELEDLVDVITIEIEVLTWAKMILANSSVPDGLIIVKSNRKEAPTVMPFGSNQSVEDMIRQWRNEVAGARNAGRLAMIQIPHGDDADFYEAATKNRDMPFQGLYELVQNIICAYMGMMPAELAIVEGSLKQASLVDSDAKASQMRYSRLTGLVNVLQSLGEVLQCLIERVNPEFTILWRGVDWTAEMERLNLEAEAVKTGRMTLNELREAANLPKYKEWYADVPAIDAILNIEAQHRGWIQRGGLGGASGNAGAAAAGRQRAKPGISGVPGSRRPGKAAQKKPVGG